MLRFAVVTDIHYGFDRGNKKGSKAPALIDRFIKAANTNRVDFAVDTGDRVIYTSPEQDRFYLLKLKDQFNKFAMPKYSVHGNHDLSYLTAEENADILGLPRGSYFKDIQDYRVLFWNPHVRITADETLSATPQDLQWLKDTLADTSRKCILFSHVPLDNDAADEADALARDGRPAISFYPQVQEIRDIIGKSGKVILCMAGHRHRNRHREIDGTHYITHQSLIQRYNDTERAYAAYSLVRIEKGRIHISGRGLEQPNYNLRIS